MKYGDEVIIRATEILPTQYHGFEGTVEKQHNKYKDFYLVWVDGNTIYFHESQLFQEPS